LQLLRKSFRKSTTWLEFNVRMKLLQIRCLALTLAVSLLSFGTPLVALPKEMGIVGVAEAHADQGSFEPVWRLLTREQKQQFVAGYLNGMRDAAKMTDLLQGLVKQNPESVTGSLDRLAQIYSDVGRASPDVMAEGIDRFYSDPVNYGAQLSAAITSAQSERAEAITKGK